MSTFRFEPHQKVKIYVQRDGQESSYASVIEDIGDTTINVLLPQENRAYILMHPGEQVRLDVFAASGVYYFYSTVQNVSLKQVGMVILDKPQYVHRVQRRKYERVRADFPVKYTVLNTPHYEGVLNVQAIEQALTYDVCPEGVCLISSAPLPVDTRLELRIQVPEAGKPAITAIARVVRSRKDQYSARYYVAMRIEEITSDDRTYLAAVIERLVNRRG
ncbi:MAG: flagellar brake protein [Candidatus Omnitrophica bacterium]|nr:flagellar brake protein [Candidatus Omnitrophota bacterium]